MRPLAIDLFTGLHGWAEGLIDAGFYVIGVDIEDMSRTVGVPKPDHFSLLIQNVLTLHGRQFKDAQLIVSSSPCPEFSYRAQPWKRAKAKTPEDVGLPVPEWWPKPEGQMTAWELHQWRDWKERFPVEPPTLGLELFHAQFRIQREASEAAGRHIPMVVENVRGAIPWVGRSKWNFGSYHLWGDVPALMPATIGRATKQNPDRINGVAGPNGSWFAVGPRGETGAAANPDGRKVPGFRFDGSGRSFQTAAVNEGLKHGGDWFSDPSSPSRQGGQVRKPPARVSKEAPAEGRKGAGAGAVWFDQNTSSLPSASPRRKAASAAIAKIPFVLSEWIGKTYLP